MRSAREPASGGPGTWCVFPSFSRFPWLVAGVTTRARGEELFEPGGSSLGASLRAVATVRQVHGQRVAVVTGPPLAPRLPASWHPPGAPAARRCPGPEASPPAHWFCGTADALTTTLCEVALVIRVADCVPALVVDAARRAVGVAHCGWRGLAQGVLGELLATMNAHFGTRAADCVAGLGPAIGPCCYEVGEDVPAALAAAGRKGAFARRKERIVLDLWQTAGEELREVGVPAKNIEALRFCTACHPELFVSYRRDGRRAGRLLSFVCVREMPAGCSDAGASRGEDGRACGS